MQSSKRIISFASFGLLVFLLTARLSAINDNNSQCNPAGGCWTACAASGGGSSEVIGASQSSECSPQPMANCSGGSEAVCGVDYSYTSDNCDPATISDSHYSYSYTCSS
jgi:hypothetical protein